MDRLFHHKIIPWNLPLLLSILLIFFFNSTGLFLYDPKVWPDESYIADISQNILKSGEVKTNLWGDMFLGTKEHFYWYPPIYLYTLAGWFKLFGSTIVSQRALSIFLGGLFICFIYFLVLKEIKQSNIRNILAASLSILLIFDHTFLKASRMGRTEMLVLVFGVLAILFYKLSADRLINKFIIGLICAVCTLTHLLGSIFFFSIILDYILAGKVSKIRIKNLVILIIGFLIPLFFWLLTIYPNYYIFLKQLSLQRHFRRIVETNLISLYKYGNFTDKLVYSFYLFQLVFVISYFINHKKYNLYFFVTILEFSIYIFGKLEWYAVYFVPLLYFCSILVISQQDWSRKYNRSSLISILLIAGLLLNLVFNTFNFFMLRQQAGKNNNYYSELSNQIIKLIPQGSTIYLSTIPDFYYSLKDSYLLYEAPVLHPQINKLIELLNDSDFVVINYHIEQVFVGNVLFRYLELNSQTQQNLISKVDTILPIEIIKLKPKNQRSKTL